MFRNLMLWWLTTGVYCVENENGQHASGHPTLGRDVDLAFALQSFILLLTFMGHDGTVSAAGRKEQTDQVFISTAAPMSAVSAQQGVNICDLNET